MESKSVEFTCQGEEYLLSISDSKLYTKYFGVIGLIEIGYGEPVIAKKIILTKKKGYHSILGGLITVNSVSDTKPKHSYSFIKELSSRLETAVSENVSDEDLIHFKPISESRSKLFKRLLEDNGWYPINSYDNFYCRNSKYNSAFFEQVKIFGTVTLTIN